MDPLSDVLSLLKPRSFLSSGFEAGGKWSVQFSDQHECIKCYAIVSGECWLSVKDVPESVHLRGGDCFVLPRGKPFCLASDLNAESVDAGIIFKPAREGGVVKLNGGGDFFLVGSRFAVSGSHTGILLQFLPPIVHIRKESDQAALRWAVERMMQELREKQPGSSLLAEHLAHMMLLLALRLYQAEGLKSGKGWLCALEDGQLGAAINAIHNDPAYDWTIQKLAEQACMSRSGFAQKFKEMVGSSPIQYVSRWRMLLAGDRLSNSNEPISAIALSVGYESESAFSAAFKRIMGCPPRRYTQSRNQNPAGF